MARRTVLLVSDSPDNMVTERFKIPPFRLPPTVIQHKNSHYQYDAVRSDDQRWVYSLIFGYIINEATDAEVL